MLSLEVAQRLRDVADSGLHQFMMDYGDQIIAGCVAATLGMAAIGIFALTVMLALWRLHR